MSSIQTRARRTTLLAVALVAVATVAGAQGMKMGKMEKMDKMEKMGKLTWGPGPGSLPAGAKLAVVSGDPGKPGPFTIQLAFPNGYKVPPHWHPSAEHIMVKQGTLLFGSGDKVDRKSMKPMKKGAEGDAPAKMNHYVMARGRTVVEIQSTGPFEITYVNAKDDPRGMMKK